MTGRSEPSTASAHKRRHVSLAAIGVALLGVVALRVASIFTVAINWDELVLLDSVVRTARFDRLFSGGHAGLVQVLLLPLVEGCRDEIVLARLARLGWLCATFLYLGGLFALLRQWLEGEHRNHDAALGVALLGLLPAFLEWSIQVRTDQIALAAGTWGAVALLASQRRPALALLAGLAFGVGWLATQKLAYVVALAGVLALGQLGARREFSLRRETGRAVAVLIGFASVFAGFRSLVSAMFSVPEQHAALTVAPPQIVGGYLAVFDFYRATIGYQQYIAELPTFVPHALLFAGLVAISLRSRRDQRPALLAIWCVLAVGVCVAAYHAAAFAYFLMTLMLFPAVALALSAPLLRDALERWQPRWVAPATYAVWAVILIPAAFQSATLLTDTQQVQRDSLAFLRRNFSGDVPGFHPESGAFCWTQQPAGRWFSQTIYSKFEGPAREAEIERLLAQFREKQIAYLIESFRLNQFPLEVRRFWAEHYQPYRDSVFVAGRRFEGETDTPMPFDLLVRGRYRWLPFDGRGAIEVDGRRLAPGATMTLTPTAHTASLEEPGAGGILVLALGEAPGPAPLAFYKSY